jgi:hypothetical protein
LVHAAGRSAYPDGSRRDDLTRWLAVGALVLVTILLVLIVLQ